jgi:hypothetical protein
MGPILVILLGCAVGWSSISMIRRGYFVGRIVFDPTRSKRYYRAGHPLQFWALAGGGLVLSVVLVGYSLSRLYWG